MKKIFTILLVSLVLFLSNNVKSQNDVGVISIDSLSNACSHSATESITIKVKNFGVLTILNGDTIPLTFQLNTNAIENDTIFLTSDFNSGDTISFTYSFTEDLSATGTYNLYASTNLSGDINANNTDTLVISTFGYPTVTLTSDTTVCSGQNVDLTVSGGISYLWNTTDTIDTISVSPMATTTYIVTVTDTNSCSTIDSTTVNVQSIAISFTGDSEICQGDTFNITASGGVSYLWNTTDTTANISYAPSSTTTYIVTVTDTNSCSSVDSITVSLHTVTVGFTGGTQVCAGDTINITANGGTSYLWSTSDTTATVGLTPTDTTTYSVIVTDAYGCSASDSITINTIATNFTFPSDTFVCAGDSVQITAAGGVSYLWNTGDTVASVWFTPTDTTTYSIAITDANSCTGTSNFTIDYNLIPTVTTSFTDTTICANYTLTCTASGASTYLWSNGATTATANLTSSANTTYTVTGTQNGCSATATVNVTTNESPDIHLEDEYDLNTDNSIVIGVTAGYTYLWNTGETTNAIFIDGDSLGVGSYDYWVKATGSNGCFTIDSTIINISWGLGFNNNDVAKINMYPNPTTNYLIISTNFDYFSYQLLDINGKIILTNDINSNVAKIDFSQFNKGVYFIKLITNDKIYINKIISK